MSQMRVEQTGLALAVVLALILSASLTHSTNFSAKTLDNYGDALSDDESQGPNDNDGSGGSGRSDDCDNDNEGSNSQTDDVGGGSRSGILGTTSTTTSTTTTTASPSTTTSPSTTLSPIEAMRAKMKDMKAKLEDKFGGQTSEVEQRGQGARRRRPGGRRPNRPTYGGGGGGGHGRGIRGGGGGRYQRTLDEPDAEFKQLMAAAGASTLSTSGGGCRGHTCEFRSTCGKAPLNGLTSGGGHASYMINGARQKYGEWPSYIRLLTKWGASMSTCGGTIISDRHILTAGHCMTDANNHKRQAVASQISVVVGEDRVGPRDAHERTFSVSHVCVSKKFDYLRLNAVPNAPESTRYDYAVLTLKDKIPFNDYWQPACLPYDHKPNVTDNKSLECFLVGTGTVGYTKQGEGILSKTVERMRMRPVSCRPYGFGDRDISRDCFSKADGPGDSCSGDSGGPVICFDPATKRWTLVSLVSYGSAKCNGVGGFGWVGAYTRITTLLPLIKAECNI